MQYRIKTITEVEGSYYSTYRYRIYQKKWWQWTWKYTGLSFTNRAHAELYILDLTGE